MRKSPEETGKMAPEEYAEYLKTLNPQERAEELLEKGRFAAAYQAEVERIKTSGIRKFDHEKFWQMTNEERVKFLQGLSPEDLDLFWKENSANLQISSQEVNKSAKGIKLDIWGLRIFMAVVYILYAGLAFVFVATLIGLFRNGFAAGDPDTAALQIVSVIIIPAAVVGVIIWYTGKRKKEKICRECGFTLIDNVGEKLMLVGTLQNLSVFKPSGIFGFSSGIGELLALNFSGQNAYMAQVVYTARNLRGRPSGAGKGQAVILEARENLPYIKIAPDAGLHALTGLKFFFKPIKELPEIKIDKKYNLFSAPEYAQRALDILPNVLKQIEDGKFILEMSGRWIVVIKLGYNENFDKFVKQAYPIAQAFNGK